MGQSLRCVWALKQLRSVDIDCDGGRRPPPLHPGSFEGLSGMTQLSSLSLRVSYLSVVAADRGGS